MAMQLVAQGRKRRRSFARPSSKRVRFAARRGRRAVQDGELKFFDTQKAATTVAQTGTVLDDSLNHIAQGVTENERVGRKCTVRSIHLHGTYQNSNVTSVNDTKNGVRIIVYLDKQANGATVAVSDILEDITATNGYNSFRNLANSGRFRILFDKRFPIHYPAVAQTAAGTFSTYLSMRNWSFHKTGLSIPLEFNGATGAIGEIRSNNIGIVGISVDSDGLPLVNYTCRLRYSDN